MRCPNVFNIIFKIKQRCSGTQFKAEGLDAEKLSIVPGEGAWQSPLSASHHKTNADCYFCLSLFSKQWKPSLGLFWWVKTCANVGLSWKWSGLTGTFQKWTISVLKFWLLRRATLCLICDLWLQWGSRNILLMSFVCTWTKWIRSSTITVVEN